MRRAFGLAQALMIILVISGIVTVTMKYASINTQHYADSYTREQAELFMQSATEAALLRIGAYNRSAGTCMSDLNVSSSDHKFNANITIERYYLADGTTCSNVPFQSIQTEESHGMVSMNVVVESNASNPKILHAVRLVRRSLQRP
jgi:hypothetical protein